MAVNYQRLWDTLADRGITRNELRKATGITANSMVKLGKNESVQVEVLAKICSALNCTMDEILEVEKVESNNTPLPEIDFSELSTESQYSILGITSISDFDFPQSAESVRSQLIRYCTRCKLSIDACEELIGVLAEKGVKIAFPKSISPNIKFIPETFSQFENESEEVKALVHQQIFNYIAWALDSCCLLEQKPFDTIAHSSKQFLIEEGYVEAHYSADSIKYKGAMMNVQSVQDTFPLNLVGAVFLGGSHYILANRLPDLFAVIDKLMGTLHPNEEFLLRIKYQYGGTTEQILRALGLPCYETLAWGIINHPKISKGLRKLRHPSRSKKFYGFFSINPYKVSNYSLIIYNDWVSEIENQVKDDLNNGRTLAEALSAFYADNVVNSVLRVENKWKGVPDVSIDEMDLSWKAYLSLEQADVHSLEQLWTAHGKHIPLTDAENTGLKNIAGLGESQISELLAKMEDYELLPIASGCVPDIVNYAERIALGNAEQPSPFDVVKPSIACNGIPNCVLQKLLEMK